MQTTIARPVKCSGIGVHSGKTVNLTIHPAPANFGIKFNRIDLPDKPCITARFNRVVDTSLATVIGADGVIVSTIEHLMAAFSGMEIDNARVEIDAHELPIMDGSAGPFARLLAEAGKKVLDAPRCFLVINEPIELAANGRFVGIYPSDKFKITCTIEFDHPAIRTQVFEAAISPQIFLEQIADARTFGFLEEVQYMKKYGLAQGGSLENAVVVDKQGVINSDGLRYKDEFVRHKVLDCIGDFSLLGLPVKGHIVTRKSGHEFHHSFLEKLFNNKSSWNTCAVNLSTSTETPLSKQLAN